ncbi:MAG: hypothetical protein ACK4WH_07195 [Phycisphaerales bacterium]
MHPCIAAADALLAQAAGFIAMLDDGLYARLCPAASGGSIGQHLRHALDHFAALFAGAGGVIDYDHRERGVAMETCRASAETALDELRAALTLVRPDELGRPTTVRVMVSRDGRTVDLATTLGRELAFATHHALHHHAMMRFIAESFGVRPAAEFGYAPSTLLAAAGADASSSACPE